MESAGERAAPTRLFEEFSAGAFAPAITQPVLKLLAPSRSLELAQTHPFAQRGRPLF